MKKEFKVGDRVAFEYLNWISSNGKVDQVYPKERCTGRISTIAEKKGYAIVRVDGEDRDRPVMLKHMRRLVKKKRRSVWIPINEQAKMNPDHGSQFVHATFGTPVTPERWIEFREVKVRK